MIVPQVKTAAVIAMMLCTGILAATEAWSKPRSIPLPDRNPVRQKLSPPKPSKTEPPKKPSPSGPVSKLPELLEYKLGDRDKEALKTTVRAVYKRRFSDARKSMSKIQDKTARKLAQWYYYRRKGNDSNPAKIKEFRLANPDWPSQKRLRRNAEQALLTGSSDAKFIKTFFDKSKPLTGSGKAALAGAYLATGDKKKAQRLASEAWRKHEFSSDIEKLLLERFGKLLTTKDHKARVDRLLLLDRKSKISAALRAAKPLGKIEKKKIDARIAVVRRSKTAKKLLAEIPEEAAKDDVGFYFSRIQWLRRHKKEEDAWKLLLAAPREPGALIAINEWWIERRINCRKALNAGHPKIAYQIASNHEPLSGKHYDEAEFLSGWIALRSLAKPEIAKQHFQALRTAASGPKTIAKAEYWLGRTAEILNLKDEAKTHYEAAAKYTLTYYGQLAVPMLKPGRSTMLLPDAPEPTQKDYDDFKARDAVQTIALIRKVELEKLAPLFFHQLARTITAPGEAVLLAELAHLMQQPHASVRLSKIAFNRGLPLAERAYPTNMLPEFKEINVPVEPALLYSLSRQESEFNPKAKSPVGARGLMQIMPRTARAIARQHKVRYKRASLTKDPSYNVMLGAAHLGDLLADYNGSYILTLVAYNAGGGRVRNWTKEFGDPRAKNVDAIDWVERIPFTETRNYVKKILNGVQIFRSRLNGPNEALRLVEDLNRGHPNPPAEVIPPAPATGN
jgi:soluble lytic murein transglycosylase